ncbi:hypothetical protein HDU98_009405, partial [Podochytrium sp. JEL0797]
TQQVALVAPVSLSPNIDKANINIEIGNFYYFKNTYLEVEGFLYGCADGITCLGAVSIRYGDSVLLGNGYQVAMTITTQDETTIIVSDIKVETAPYNSHMIVVITLSSFLAGATNTGKCANTAEGQQDWPVDASDDHMNGAYVPGACVYPLAEQNVAAVPSVPSVPGLSFYPGMSFNATSYRL